ncbi:MAG: hypothetical protein ACO1RT_12960 [Planctomycetaceae bacterium]
MREKSKQFASDEEPAKKAASEFAAPEKTPQPSAPKKMDSEFEVEERLKKLGDKDSH